QLMRVGPAFVQDRNGFRTPYQLCAAHSKLLPSHKRQLTRTSVGLGVPTFHRLDRESISYAAAVHDDKPRERRCVSALDAIVEGNRQAAFLQMTAKSLRISNAADVQEACTAHSSTAVSNVCFKRCFKLTGRLRREASSFEHGSLS